MHARVVEKTPKSVPDGGAAHVTPLRTFNCTFMTNFMASFSITWVTSQALTSSEKSKSEAPTPYLDL